MGNPCTETAIKKQMAPGARAVNLYHHDVTPLRGLSALMWIRSKGWIVRKAERHHLPVQRSARRLLGPDLNK